MDSECPKDSQDKERRFFLQERHTYYYNGNSLDKFLLKLVSLVEVKAAVRLLISE